MKEYYELLTSVYAKDTQAFIDFVTKEYFVALNCKLNSKKLECIELSKNNYY